MEEAKEVGMPRVVHFEIPAVEPERAAEFYRSVFGWKIEKWEGPVDYWLVTTGGDQEPGINGAIKNRVGPEHSVCNTISVPSVDAFVKRIEDSGGKAVSPKMAIPGVGYHAYCEDTEGVVFGLIEDDPSAQ